jgi:hypothetical protein
MKQKCMGKTKKRLCNHFAEFVNLPHKLNCITSAESCDAGSSHVYLLFILIWMAMKKLKIKFNVRNYLLMLNQNHWSVMRWFRTAASQDLPEDTILWHLECRTDRCWSWQMEAFPFYSLILSQINHSIRVLPRAKI